MHQRFVTLVLELAAEHAEHAVVCVFWPIPSAARAKARRAALAMVAAAWPASGYAQSLVHGSETRAPDDGGQVVELLLPGIVPGQRPWQGAYPLA